MEGVWLLAAVFPWHVGARVFGKGKAYSNFGSFVVVSFPDSTHHCVKVALANNDVILGSAEVSSCWLPSDRNLAGWSLACLDQPMFTVFSEPLECVATTFRLVASNTIVLCCYIFYQYSENYFNTSTCSFS